MSIRFESIPSCLTVEARRTGRDSLPGYDFAVAFTFFRLAAIFHGIKGRVLRGTAANAHAHAQKRVAMLPKLIRVAWDRPSAPARGNLGCA